VRHHRLRNGGTPLLSREPSGMSATEVKSIPTLVFQGPGNGSGTTETCAICLEDYEIGEKLRLLPCNHGNILPFLLPHPPPLSPSLPSKSTYKWSLIPRSVFSISAKPAGFILVWCTCWLCFTIMDLHFVSNSVSRVLFWSSWSDI
jgi:hypothetical protein